MLFTKLFAFMAFVGVSTENMDENKVLISFTARNPSTHTKVFFTPHNLGHFCTNVVLVPCKATMCSKHALGSSR